MARLQNALTKQLTDEHERVDLQLREKEDEVRRVKKDREETGVQLYGVQHQLEQIFLVLLGSDWLLPSQQLRVEDKQFKTTWKK